MEQIVNTRESGQNRLLLDLSKASETSTLDLFSISCCSVVTPCLAQGVIGKGRSPQRPSPGKRSPGLTVLAGTASGLCVSSLGSLGDSGTPSAFLGVFQSRWSESWQKAIYTNDMVMS